MYLIFKNAIGFEHDTCIGSWRKLHIKKNCRKYLNIKLVFGFPVYLLTLWSLLILSTVVFVWIFQFVRISCFLDFLLSILSQFLSLLHVILTIYFCLLLWFQKEKLKDKDAQIVEIRKLLSERQDIISKLEQDLSKCKLDLNEREKRINDILLVEVHFSLVISLVVSWMLQTQDLHCPPFSFLLLLKCAG